MLTILLTPVLRQILIGYELHCCHVSDFVVIIELFPCCNCIPTLLQCLRLISSVDWSLNHVAAGHVAGDHLPPWLPDLKCRFCRSLPSLQRDHCYLLWLHNFSISEELVLKKLSLMHRFAFSMPFTQRFRTHGRPL